MWCQSFACTVLKRYCVSETASRTSKPAVVTFLSTLSSLTLKSAHASICGVSSTAVCFVEIRLLQFGMPRFLLWFHTKWHAHRRTITTRGGRGGGILKCEVWRSMSLLLLRSPGKDLERLRSTAERRANHAFLFSSLRVLCCESPSFNGPGLRRHSSLLGDVCQPRLAT